MSTPITIGDDILDSIRDFMLLLLLNVASGINQTDDTLSFDRQAVQPEKR